MTVSSSLWVCQRQQSGCSLLPVASHPSGHKNPWHGVTGATTSCPTPEGRVTGWMERSLDVEWWDSSLLAVISNPTLSPTQLNLHLPPSLSLELCTSTHTLRASSSHTLGHKYICIHCQFRRCINIAESTYRWRVQVLSHHYVSLQYTHIGRTGGRQVTVAPEHWTVLSR